MDDLNMVRDFLREPAGPTPETITRAEDRLSAEFTRAGRRHRLLRGVGLRGVGLKIALPALAAGAAAAVAVATLIPGGSTARRHTVEPVALPARQVMLAAASQLETTPGTGKYWVVRTHVASMVVVGPKSDPYRIMNAFALDDWTTRDGKHEWFNTRNLGAKPVSQADWAAWRRNGSPTTWKNPFGPPPPGEPNDDLHMAPERRGGTPAPMSEQKRAAWDKGPIPDDPAKIRKMMLAAGPPPEPGDPPRTPNPRADDSTVFHFTKDVLTKAATPRVRAAVYKVLADLPELTVKKNVRDPEGRIGTGVSWNEGDLGEEIIIDPATCQTLAWVQIALKDQFDPVTRAKAGDFLDYTTITSAGWSNQTPTP